MSPVVRVRWSASSVLACAIALAAPSRGAAQAVLETFDGPQQGWKVASDVAGAAVVQPSTARVASGSASARAATSAAGAQAALRATYSDAGASHVWNERPGTYRWHRGKVYVPDTTLAQLGSGYMTIARMSASGQPTVGWSLRVRQGGALSVVGTRDFDGAQFEFPVYASLPANTWVDLEVGLHSQNGPGVKRAFAFLVDGRFHGWYHQGRLKNEVYDRVGIGVVETDVSGALEVFVDDWGAEGTSRFPTGPDARATSTLQDIDYRSVSGADWQIDWTTWANQLRLHPTHGLYSDTDRLQSGRNIDRMPDLTSGWAEIEIGWPKGTPPTSPTTYFGPMVGFRKEINREQNLEVIPIGRGGGNVDLVLEAWDGDGPIPLAQWQMPMASAGGTRIPEPGDIIRARWEQVGASTLAVRASFYDASASTWHADVISTQVALGNINGVNFADGSHTASSVTTDSPFYSIRRFRVGTLETYGGGPPPPAPIVQPPSGLAVTGVTATHVALQWHPPASDPQPTGYVLAGGTSPGASQSEIAIGAGTLSATVPLSPGVFYLRMHVVSSTSRSTPSNEVRVVVGASEPPSAPSHLVGVVEGTSVTLHWRETFLGGTPTAARLDVTGSYVGVLPLAAGGAAAFAGVASGAYSVQVRTVNAAGPSPPSNVVSLSVPGPCAPSTPSHVVAWATGRTLAMAWTSAGSGRPATGFIVSVTGALAGEFPTAGLGLSGVVGPGAYGLRVRAVNGCGQSAPSAEQIVTVL